MTVFGHVTPLSVIRAIKVPIPQCWVSNNFRRPNKEGLPFDFLHDFIDRLLENSFKSPKSRGHIVFGGRLVFSCISGPSSRFRCDRLGLSHSLNREGPASIFFNVDKLIYLVHQFSQVPGGMLDERLVQARIGGQSHFKGGNRHLFPACLYIVIRLPEPDGIIFQSLVVL